MRIVDEGAYVRVVVSRDEVEAFKARWPCSTLPNRAVSFTFDRKNGDLVDLTPESMDGPDVLALSMDAQRFAGV